MASNHLTEDSIAYAYSAVTGERLIHPHHLLYNALMRVVVLVFPGGGIETLILALQLTNMTLTMMAAMTFYFVVRGIGAPLWASVVYSLFFALSWGVLAYSSQIEVYNVTVVCLVLALLGLVHHGRSTWSPLVIGVAYSTAMLFHQTAIFFGAAIIVHELLHTKRHSFRRLAVTFALPLVVVGMLYLAAGWFQGCRNLRDYWHWVTSYAQIGHWGKGSLSIGTIRSALHGMTASIIGKQWEFALVLLPLLGLHVCGQLLADGRHMARNWTIIAACLAWFALQATFNMWWFANNPEFWIPTILPLTLILVAVAHSHDGRSCRRLPQRIRHIPIIFITILVAVSACAHYRENRMENLLKLRAARCAKFARSQDVIITSGTDLQQYCRLYMRGNRVIAINSELAGDAAKSSASATFTKTLLDRLAHEVRYAEQRGGTVFVDQRLVEGVLPTTRWMRNFDSEIFSIGLARQFSVTPVKSDAKSLWSTIAFPTGGAAVKGLDAEQGAGIDK